MKAHKPRRLAIFARSVLTAWALLWIFFHVLPFEGYYYKNLWSTWWFPLLLAGFMVLTFGAIQYLFTMIVFGLVMADDPQYRYARRLGWHPFWSQISWPYNPDGDTPMPTYPTRYCCPTCGTPHPSAFGICGACGYGSST